ncbi:hypothetical protein F8388_001554 [Cannabis sativa]|uniref:Uncharacterized protein n=1 Tax=Cannabis sativa TaxID=3483 RepID=A0A7J6HIT0_CANSA|nr:hypothetical protein F8388_001554 [Cannabis sativa]
MAEHTESAEAKSESLIEKITEKIHGHGDSSSPSSDSESEQVKPESPSSVKTKIFWLFGRERPVHQVFGGGKRSVVESGNYQAPFDESLLLKVKSEKVKPYLEGRCI